MDEDELLGVWCSLMVWGERQNSFVGEKGSAPGQVGESPLTSRCMLDAITSLVHGSA